VIEFSGTNSSTIAFNNINVETAGTYSIKFRYCNGFGHTTRIRVYANDALASTLYCPPSGLWSFDWGIVDANVELRAGNNVIRLQPDSNTDAINLDYIEITKAAATDSVIMIFSPHEDDEVISFGGTIQKALAEGHRVIVVLVTNGDIGGVGAGLARIKESVDGLRILGMRQSDIFFLGYPDCAYLEKMHYNPNDSFTSDYTGQSFTYGNEAIGALDYHKLVTGASAPLTGNNVAWDIKHIIDAYRPNDIYTLSEYDTHTDHSHTYKFVDKAINDIRVLDPSYKPKLYYTIESFGMLGYTWPGYPGQYLPELSFPCPFDLEPTTPLRWNERITISLSLAMCEKKKEALDMYNTGGGYWYYHFIRNEEFYWVKEF